MKKAKKLLVTLLVLTFVLSTFSVGFAANEEKLPTEVVRAKALGILRGDDQGNLNLDKPITRAEALALIVRISGLETSAELMKGQTKFADVNPDASLQWATGYINLGVGQNIVNGYPDGTFKGNAQVTYAEMAKMILYAMNYGVTVEGAPWPAGVMGKADDLEIFKKVNALPNVPALRGDVVKMIDNSLEIKHLVQEGYGDLKTYKEGDKTFLSKMNVEELDEVIVTAIPRIDSKLKDDEIKLGSKKYKVLADIDLEELFGQEVTVFLNDDDEIISVEIDSDFYYDALKDITDKKLKLVDADEKYDFAEEVTVYINAESKELKDIKGNKYDYAKIVLNEDGDVAFVDAYVWEDYLVVEEVDDETVFGYGDEVDIEDFVIVKDGKAIVADDLEKGDIFFYNSNAGDGFAEVFNKTVSGEIEEVFNASFEVDGETYDYQNIGYYGDKSVQYINEDDEIDDFDKDVAEQMQEEEGEVAVFVDRSGNAVFVSGELGEVEKSTLAGILYENLSAYKDTRGREYIEIKMVNENGKAVTYDFRLSDLKALTVDGTELWDDDMAALGYFGSAPLFDGINVGSTTLVTFAGTANKEDIVEVTLDADGDVIELAFFTSDKDSIVADDKVKSTDKYIKTYKTSKNVPVFFIEDSSWDKDDVEVKTLGDLDEIQINTGKVFHDGSDVLYIVVTDSDLEDTTKYKGVITDIRENTDGDITRIKALVDDKETTYYMDDPAKINGTWTEGMAVEIEVYDQTGRVKQLISVGTTPTFTVGSGFQVVVRDREITSDGTNTNTWKLVSEGYIYDVTDPSDIESMSLSELRNVKAGTTITVVLDKAGTKYAKLILVGAAPSSTAGDFGFSIADPKSATLTVATAGANWGRTVAVSVYTNMDEAWAASVANCEAEVDKDLITASGISARSVSGVNFIKASNTLSFNVVFNEDVYLSDTLEIAANAIVITGKDAGGVKVQDATVKKGQIDIN